MFNPNQPATSKLMAWQRIILALSLLITNLATVVMASAAPMTTDIQPSLPIRAAFYYPWFPEAWNQQGFYPFTNYNPSLGFYDLGNQSVISQHIAAMQYGGIQAGIASWWGQGSKTDNRIPALLQAAAGTSFRWSIYYELESQGDPSVSQITNDLTYIRDRYGNDPSFLRIGGRFVVFVYADAADGCGMVDRWKQANTVGAYLVLKVFSGYRTCANQPDGWHQYAPAVAVDSQPGYSYSISPGFWKKGEAIRLSRNLNTWNQSIQGMIASGAPFQLITTFNEWGEGTSVESASEWASSSGYGVYLDILHNYGGASPQPTVTAQPTSISTATPLASPTTIVNPTATAQPTSISTATPLASPTTIVNPTTTATPITSSTDPVIAAAGDIACDPADGSFNGGNGTASNCRQKAVSDLLVGTNLAAVLALGDIQYEDGTLAKYQQSFDPSWGRVKNIIHPAVGNHEYLTSGAAGYYSYFGAAAGDPNQGYYSYNIGAWHLIALNSNCSKAGGCGPGSPQEQWLKADLATHPTMCTLAYWHHPRFSSGEHGNNTNYDTFWKDLYAAGADIVLNGHDHDYERFALQNPSGVADPNGIQAFVVGTGGKNHYAFTSVQPNSLVRNSDTYGVLKLTLHATSYDWQFVHEAGKTFTDSGSMNCRNAAGTSPTVPSPTPTTAPTQTAVPTIVSTTPTPIATNNNPTVTPTVMATSTSTTATPTAIATTAVPPTPTDSSTTTSSTKLVFTPIADAYVNSAYPDRNYGHNIKIRVDGSPTVRSYLLFNVEGLTNKVTNATLRIYANSRSSAGLQAYAVTDTGWIELNITYNNAPPLGDPGGTSGSFSGGTWITVDVTPLIHGNGVVSLALTGINTTAISLASRESGSNAPQLVITTP